MGLRKIEDEIDFKKVMAAKGAELRLKAIQAKADVEKLTQERINDLAKNHGVILALTPELKSQVKLLQKRYNIPASRIITEQITEDDVMKKSSKVDLKKLGMLAYQRVLMQKEETGGILAISDVFEIVNTGILKGNLDIKDLLKSMRILKKSGVIEDMILLESGLTVIHFFPIQFTGDHARVIELAKKEGYISLEDVCVHLEWSQDRAIRALESLEKSGIAKFRESILTGKQWYFPSVQ